MAPFLFLDDDSLRRVAAFLGRGTAALVLARVNRHARAVFGRRWFPVARLTYDALDWLAAAAPALRGLSLRFGCSSPVVCIAMAHRLAHLTELDIASPVLRRDPASLQYVWHVPELPPALRRLRLRCRADVDADGAVRRRRRGAAAPALGHLILVAVTLPLPLPAGLEHVHVDRGWIASDLRAADPAALRSLRAVCAVVMYLPPRLETLVLEGEDGLLPHGGTASLPPTLRCLHLRGSTGAPAHGALASAIGGACPFLGSLETVAHSSVLDALDAARPPLHTCILAPVVPNPYHGVCLPEAVERHRRRAGFACLPVDAWRRAPFLVQPETDRLCLYDASFYTIDDATTTTPLVCEIDRHYAPPPRPGTWILVNPPEPVERLLAVHLHRVRALHLRHGVRHLPYDHYQHQPPPMLVHLTPATLTTLLPHLEELTIDRGVVVEPPPPSVTWRAHYAAAVAAAPAPGRLRLVICDCRFTHICTDVLAAIGSVCVDVDLRIVVTTGDALHPITTVAQYAPHIAALRVAVHNHAGVGGRNLAANNVNFGALVAVLVSAVAVSLRCLRELELSYWCAAAVEHLEPAASALIGATADHPTLRRIDLRYGAGLPVNGDPGVTRTIQNLARACGGAAGTPQLRLRFVPPIYSDAATLHDLYERHHRYCAAAVADINAEWARFRPLPWFVELTPPHRSDSPDADAAADIFR